MHLLLHHRALYQIVIFVVIGITIPIRAARAKGTDFDDLDLRAPKSSQELFADNRLKNNSHYHASKIRSVQFGVFLISSIIIKLEIKSFLNDKQKMWIELI